MKKLILLFSHNLTTDQITEINNKLNIEEFISLPDNLQKLWSNFPPEGEFPCEIADKFIYFLEKYSDKKDYILIQGEFGLVYYIVNWCFDNERIPIYATSKRVFFEEKYSNGEIKNIHIFKHINFRKYVKKVGDIG